jgi:hypothetical protein
LTTRGVAAGRLEALSELAQELVRDQAEPAFRVLVNRRTASAVELTLPPGPLRADRLID